MGFSFVYQLVLSFGFLLYLPKLFVDFVLHKKSMRLKKRFRWSFLPLKKKKGPCIFLHAVSVGETKAAAAVLKALNNKYPSAYFVVSSVTETGHQEALKTFPTFLLDSLS